jgi:hypothetical protein
MKYIINESQLKMIRKYMKTFINEQMSDDEYIEYERRQEKGDKQTYPVSDKYDDEYDTPVEKEIEITITDKHNGKPLMLVQIAAEGNEEGFTEAQFVDVIPDEKIFFKKIEDKVNFIKSYFEKLEASNKLIDFIDKIYFDKMQRDVLEKTMSFSEFQS